MFSFLLYSTDRYFVTCLCLVETVNHTLRDKHLLSKHVTHCVMAMADAKSLGQLHRRYS